MRASVVAVAALCLCGAARAQLGDLRRPVSLGVRAGGFWPGSRPAGVGRSWFAAGADLRVNVAALPIVGGQTVSLDYLAKNGNTITGITLVQRFSSPVAAPVQGGVRPYAGFGFGVYRVHVRSDMESRTKTGPGVKALVGLDIGQSLYVQGDYHMPLMGRVAGLRASGVGITAGLRF